MGMRVPPGETLGDLMRQAVRVGDLLVPPRFWYDFAPAEGGGPVLRLYVEVRNGRMEIRKIEIESSPDGREISARDLREAARVEDHIEAALGDVALPVLADDGKTVATPVLPSPKRGRVAARAIRTAQRRTMTPDRLAEVAEVYREAWPKAPTQAVADHIGKSPRAALDWINAARAAGHDLPAAPRGPAPRGGKGN
jgi:hypothetical protein